MSQCSKPKRLSQTQSSEERFETPTIQINNVPWWFESFTPSMEIFFALRDFCFLTSLFIFPAAFIHSPPVAQTVEHGASNNKVMGLIPRESMTSNQ